MEIESNIVKKVSFGVVNDAPIESMVQNALTNGKPLCWSNGTLFSFEPFAFTEWSSKEAAAGNVYYLSLTKCPMDKYESAITDDNNNSIPVLNLDHHAFWKEVLANV